MKLRSIFVLLFLSIFMLFGSASYAWTLNDFFDYADQIKSDTNAPTSLRQLATNVINQKSRITTLYNQNGNNASTIVCNVSQYNLNKNLDCFIIYLSNSTNYNITFNSSGALLSTEIGRIIKDSSSAARWSSGSSSGRELNGLCFGLCETSNILNSNYYFNNKYVPPYTGPVFTPANNGLINVYKNGVFSFQANRLPFGYVFPTDTTLGYLSDYEDCYGVWGYFGPLVYYSGDSNYFDSSSCQFDYTDYHGLYYNKLYFDSSTGRVSISNDSLIAGQTYNLYFTYQEQYGVNDFVDFGETNYYAYLYNNPYSSGEAISPNLNSNVDITMLNALEKFLNNDDQDKNNINYELNGLFKFSGDFLSGDFFSGDLFNNLGFDDSYLDNDYSLFVYRVYRAFLGQMRSDDINSSITFTIHNHTYTYYASDFHVPDSPLKTFISYFLITIIVCLLIYQIHFVFITIATLDIFGLSRSFDQDHTIFM